MKKVKFLIVFVTVLIVVYVILFLSNLYLLVYPPEFMKFPPETRLNFIFGDYTQLLNFSLPLINLIGLIVVKRGLGYIISQGFFNTSCSVYFKNAGKIFLMSGFLGLVFNTILLYRSEELLFFGEMGQGFLLMIIGFSLYVVSDILLGGNLIKQENDLTI